VTARVRRRIAGLSARLHERAERRLAARFDGAVVLLYHRVTPLEPDPFSMAMPPEQFDEQLRVIRSGYQPLTLQELAAALRRRRVPRRGVVVTFDDGYADNLDVASPLLAAHGIPATVFVATAYVNGRREFWWDELERLMRQATDMGAEVTLEICGERLVNQRLTKQSLPTALMDLQFRMRSSTAAEIAHILRQLRASVGQQADGETRDSHRPLRIDELRRLSADGLIEVGAHTRWHASLARASRGEQLDELGGSKSDLEEWLDARVTSVSFPFGRRARDYTRRTVRIAREVGFEAAAVRSPARATALSSPMEMPRVVAPAIDGGEFERWLAQQFEH
jgi:peptidoglycan/xylan/chitin deacetylase (PgdA/CDA1 family)